jgi:hypothetical protein
MACGETRQLGFCPYSAAISRAFCPVGATITRAFCLCGEPVPPVRATLNAPSMPSKPLKKSVATPAPEQRPPPANGVHKDFLGMFLPAVIAMLVLVYGAVHLRMPRGI